MFLFTLFKCDDYKILNDIHGLHYISIGEH